MITMMVKEEVENEGRKMGGIFVYNIVNVIRNMVLK